MDYKQVAMHTAEAGGAVNGSILYPLGACAFQVVMTAAGTINPETSIDVVSGGSTWVAIQVDDAAAVAVCDYNAWYTAGGTVYANIAGSLYHSDDQAAYQAATGWDAHGLWQDPLVVSASDLSLQAGSPCINAGVSVGLTADILGHAIVGAPDMGAYEYQP